VANLTGGHRRHQMIVAPEGWQPIDGVGSAVQTLSCSAGVHSIDIPSAAKGMIITADVNIAIGLRSTFNPTASQGYLLASMTPSPTLLIPRHGDLSADKSVVRFRAMAATGRITFNFITGRGR
jgi:hypothetical protein